MEYEAAASEWRIEGWEMRKMHTATSRQLLFVESLTEALPDVADLQRARRSLHHQAAIRYYDRVRAKAPTWADQYRGGRRMGKAFLAAGEYEAAKKAYRNVAGNAPNQKDKGAALQAWGDVHYAEGDVEGARDLHPRILSERRGGPSHQPGPFMRVRSESLQPKTHEYSG